MKARHIWERRAGNDRFETACGMRLPADEPTDLETRWDIDFTTTTCLRCLRQTRNTNLRQAVGHTTRALAASDALDRERGRRAKRKREAASE